MYKAVWYFNGRHEASSDNKETILEIARLVCAIKGVYVHVFDVESNPVPFYTGGGNDV